MGGSWARREWRSLQQKSSFAARQRGVFYDKEKSMTESARLVITVDSSQALAAGRDLSMVERQVSTKVSAVLSLVGSPAKDAVTVAAGGGSQSRQSAVDAEVAKSKPAEVKATPWGQLTQGAETLVSDALKKIRKDVDSAFVDAWNDAGKGFKRTFTDIWKNIGKGFSETALNLKNGFKQLLAELAHAAITRPILLQIGAAFGVGGLLANQSGASAGAAGDGVGGVLGAVKSLFNLSDSAFGKSLSSGWGAGDGLWGGLKGAASSGYDYLSGLFGAGANSASSMASGATAAAYSGPQMANWIAAQNNSTFTGALGGSGAILGGLLGAYQGWKINGLKGGIGGGLGGWGGGALGTMAGTAAASALSGTAMGAAFGSALPGIGTAIGAALGAAFGSKLFAGKWQTKDQGIQLGVTSGELNANSFEYQKKSGGLFGSNKKRTKLSALDEATQKSLDDAYDSTEGAVKDLYKRLNVTLNDGVLNGLNIAALQISTKDKTDQQIQAEIGKWFGGVADSMTSAIDAATGAGLAGYDFEGLTDFVNNLYTVNDAFNTLNLKLYDVSVAGGKMSEGLVKIAGGIDAFKTATATYYDNFYTDVEKANNVLSAVAKQFADQKVDLPDSRQAFRAVIDGLDLTTEAGQKMFATLTQLSGSAAASYTILEQRAAAASQTQAEALNGAVTKAMSAVQRAVSSQQKSLTDAYNARNASLNDMASTAQSNVSAMTAVSNSLKGALKSLLGTSDDAVKMLHSQAQATLQSALATARAGGSLTGFTGLDDALSAVTSNNTDLYSSLEAFNRDQGRTANVVAELNAINGTQLTAQEQLLQTVQDQIKQAKLQYDTEMGKLDKQLEFAQSQLDALNGVDTSVISVTAALGALNSAVLAAMAVKPAGSAAANTPQNNTEFVKDAYLDVLGRDADSAGLAYWVNQLQSGVLSYSDLSEAITNAAKSNGEIPNTVKLKGEVQALSTGGNHLGGLRIVGEDGPELEATGPSRIYNANQTMKLLSGGSDSSETVAELRQLRAEMEGSLSWIGKFIEQTANSTRQMKDSGVQIVGTIQTKVAA